NPATSTVFAPASDLPPCGMNTNSSRTWITIRDENNRSLSGFCGLRSTTDLSNIWFAVSLNEPTPVFVYITLEDRRCRMTYSSELVAVPSFLSGQLFSDGAFELTIRSRQGASIEIQSSTDLIAWTTITHLITNELGILTYRD